jgi:hypothetical protein
MDMAITVRMEQSSYTEVLHLAAPRTNMCTVLKGERLLSSDGNRNGILYFDQKYYLTAEMLHNQRLSSAPVDRCQEANGSAGGSRSSVGAV